MTDTSAFFPPKLRRAAQAQIARRKDAAAERDRLVAAAAPWLARSDDDLWGLMFANTIKRSWMVWSNGFCPACKRDVPMYNWLMDAMSAPWKTQCPHCKERFPKNDFAAFYRSGLDAHGLFDPKKADRTLLFNAEHPGANDPLRGFGVDDGEGFVDGGHRWRFIGAYLIYGQWKQAIVGGIEKLAAAYVVTGDAAYAHKAGVLLDRVADLYPTHDFGKEGVMYEGPPRSGYVSTWHDACVETRSMALCFDMVRPGIAQDAALAGFLAEKAKRYQIARPKATPADVLDNIAAGILRDPQKRRDGIYSNYPQTDLTVAILKAVDAGSVSAAEADFDPILAQATAVDGVTGEKGLTGYSAYGPQQLALVLALFARAEPAFLDRLLARQPKLAAMYRFFLDTWIDGTFYPNVGDCGVVGYPAKQYVGVNFTQWPGVQPSMYGFLAQLSEKTGDPGFAQALWKANGEKADGLPFDLFEGNPERFQKKVAAIVARHGRLPKAASRNFEQWHLAILRATDAPDSPALWLDYDSGGYHNHADGLNVGLFAHGLDLLPDFGYPPVQFGGWGSEKSLWYTKTAAHNTVGVDGRDHRSLAGPMTERAGFEGKPGGKTTLWATGPTLQAIRVDGRGMETAAERFERTLVLVNVGADCYVVDLFRVAGGKERTRFTHSGFGTVATDGLSLSPAPDYGHGAQLRRTRGDAKPAPGWSVTWTLEDRHKTATAGPPVRLTLTDFTESARAELAEAWTASKGIADTTEEWLPCVLTRHDVGPATTFVAVLQPHRGQPPLSKLTRVNATGGTVGLRLRRADGGEDWLWLADPEARVAGRPAADLVFYRSGPDTRLVICGGTFADVDGLRVELNRRVDYLELALEPGVARVVAGPADALTRAVRDGLPQRLQTR